MSRDDDERMRNFLLFKLPLTDKEMGDPPGTIVWAIIAGVCLAMIFIVWSISG